MAIKRPKYPNNQAPKHARRNVGSRVWLIGCLGTFVFLWGCGGADLPLTIPVSGTVSVNGSSCPGPGSLRFTPIRVADGMPRRPGRADFDTDGRFEVTSFRDGDGLVPGTYRVQLECWQTPPANGQSGVSYLAADYQPPELTVGRDQRSFVFDIDAPEAKQ